MAKGESASLALGTQLHKVRPGTQQNPAGLEPAGDVSSGADRDRTGDPLLAKQVLSQLSYRPEGLRR